MQDGFRPNARTAPFGLPRAVSIRVDPGMSPLRVFLNSAKYRSARLTPKPMQECTVDPSIYGLLGSLRLRRIIASTARSGRNRRSGMRSLAMGVTR